MSTARARLEVVAGPSARPARPGATERIVEAITLAIVERRLMPGTKLAEQRLAGIFGVSRTIVRQALNRLSRDRLVTIEPARGAFVAAPSDEEAKQVFELRAMLETALVRMLCERIVPAQVARLRAHLRDERQALARGDVARRTRLLADFHVVLAGLTGNQVLAQTLRDLLGRSQLIALMYQSGHSADESHREHVELVDAIERRDARGATRLMARHIDRVERNRRRDPGSVDLGVALRPKE